MCNVLTRSIFNRPICYFVRASQGALECSVRCPHGDYTTMTTFIWFLRWPCVYLTGHAGQSQGKRTICIGLICSKISEKPYGQRTLPVRCPQVARKSAVRPPNFVTDRRVCCTWATVTLRRWITASLRAHNFARQPYSCRTAAARFSTFFALDSP